MRLTSAPRTCLLLLFLLLLASLAGAQAPPSPAEDGSQPDPTKPEEREPIVYCPVCDSIPEKGDLHCARDGTELKTLLPPEHPECPQCFRKGQPGDLHCRFEGAKLKVPTLAPDEKRQLFEIYHGRGLGAEKAGEWGRAAAFFEVAAPFADPGRRASVRARAHRGRGRQLLGEDRMEPAVLELLIAASLDPKAAETYVALGDLYARGGKVRDAVLAYDRAIALDGTLARPWAGRGGVRATRGDLAGALEDLAKAIELDPESPDARLRRAVLHLSRRDTAAAEADASEAIRLAPEDARAWIVRGTVRAMRGAAEEALIDLDRAIEIDAKLAEAHYRRGLALLELGDRERAETAFAVAVGLDGDYAGVVFEAAKALGAGATDPRAIRAAVAIRAGQEALAKGQGIEAVRRFLTALQFRPGDPEVLMALGDAYRQSRRTEDAVAAYGEALRVAPRFVAALFARGFTHHEAGRLDEAQVDYEAALALESGNALALNALGNVHFARSRFEEAEKAYTRAIGQDAGFARAYHNRGLARSALGRKDEARRDQEAALLLDPENVEVLVQVGLLALEAKDVPRARRAFRLAAELAPGDALPRYDLAVALEYDDEGRRYGDGFPRDQAILAHQRVLRLQPRHRSASLNLGILLIQAGRHEEAVETLRRAVSLAPDGVSALYHLGLALEYGKGGVRGGEGSRLDEAIKVYGQALDRDGENVSARLNRALAEIRLGRDEEAEADLTRLRELSPSNADVEYNLAIVLERLGRRDEAGEALTRFTQKGGDRAAAEALRATW